MKIGLVWIETDETDPKQVQKTMIKIAVALGVVEVNRALDKERDLERRPGNLKPKEGSRISIRVLGVVRLKIELDLEVRLENTSA